MKMRPIEMAVAYYGGQWNEMMVEIPDDTPENSVERVAINDVIDLHKNSKSKPVAHIWVYNSLEDERPE